MLSFFIAAFELMAENLVLALRGDEGELLAEHFQAPGDLSAGLFCRYGRGGEAPALVVHEVIAAFQSHDAAVIQRH